MSSTLASTKFYVFSWEKEGTAGTTGEIASLVVTASNEYGVFSREAYPWLDSPVVGSQLVEPYKATTFTISDSSSDNSYIWTVDAADVEVVKSDDPTVLQGPSIVLKFKSTGVYTLTVAEYDPTNALVQSTTISAICKYVKRELRTLTVDDREAFLDAAAMIWKYTTEEGQALYGDKFTGIEKFTALHIIQSNDMRCDSYHEGSAFITHHLALSVSFDAALRAVNPAVTLPYWDFTIEGQAIASAKKTPSYMLQVSPVFSDTWFGEVDGNSHIVNSRWANTKIPLADASTPRHLKNSFGHWRSYWNNNPDPYVTRHMFEMCGLEPTHKKVPSCSSHFSVLNTTSLGDLQMVIPSDGHGPVHIQVGGLYGSCADGYREFTTKWAAVLDEDMTAEQVAAYGFDSSNWGYGLKAPRRGMFEKSIMGEYFHIFRAFWRSHMCAVDGTPGLLECPDTCDSMEIAKKLGLMGGGDGGDGMTSTATVEGEMGEMGQDAFTTDVANKVIEQCPCTVTKLVDGSTTWQNVYPCVVASTKQALFNAVMPAELLEDMVNMIAKNPLLHGDMIESSSPADIVFWLVHPALDRMLVAKRLPAVRLMGDTEFVKWAVPDGSTEDWLEWTPYTVPAGMSAYYPEAYTCVGHGKDDGVLSVKLPLTESILQTALQVDAGGEGNGDGDISNWEFFLSIDPNNVHGVDMVYDHFLWDHCKASSIEQQYVGITTKVVHTTSATTLAV